MWASGTCSFLVKRSLSVTVFAFWAASTMLLRFAHMYSYDKSLFNKLVIGEPGASQLA